ncbi:hypothetical protein PRZ48_012745 [Zasmidium cellare]|uniref:Uncharacterized protein n=1 Tax=Zasmidium cellare TaxID=395010 RepID=A0ABR0E5R3_ZASCE|nr:hypothetical protein PRZ48_012745 [Zasmidium cellare]
MISTILLSVLCILPSLVWAGNYSNPLKANNAGDPNIVYENGWYYLMSTTGADLQMTRAHTLDGLKHGETKQVFKDSTPSRCCNVWAPEMHKVGGAWHIYYAAGAGGDEQHAHVIKGGASPWDAYTYLGQMRPDWSIDGTLLTINQKNYFVYSGRDTDGVQSLFIAPMTGAATSGQRSLLAKPTQSWETNGFGVNEGPFALYHGGRTWLTFSASFCATAQYSLGLLTYNGGDPLQRGSWTKSSGPVFQSADGNYGPGHNSFFTSPDGSQIWNVYHATHNSSGNCGGDRYANALIVNWKSDGTPDFGVPPEVGAVLPGPKGE